MADKKEREVRQKAKGGLALFLLLVLLLCEVSYFDCHAANKYGTFVGKKPDTYSIQGDTVYFYPKKIYYSGSKVICYVYVVNKTGRKITGLSDTTLSIRDKNNKVVAKHTFSEKKNLTIRNNKYKTVKYIFPKGSVKKKKFYFNKAGRMSIKASFVFYQE